MVIVPVLSVGLWISKFELVWSDQNNNLKSWLFTYSASGIFQVINYLTVIREIIRTLTEESEGHVAVHQEITETEKILNIYDEDNVLVVEDVCDSVTIFKGRSDIRKSINKFYKWKRKEFKTKNSPYISDAGLKQCVDLMMDSSEEGVLRFDFMSKKYSMQQQHGFKNTKVLKSIDDSTGVVIGMSRFSVIVAF